MALSFNEGKVCEAIVRYLEVREGQSRSDVFSPESVNHPNPVELAWTLGTQVFALEHTGIEPFDDHMRLEAESKRHFEPIIEALTGLFSPEIIEIHVPIRAMLDRNKPEIKRIQKALIEWVQETAPTLETRRYAKYTKGDQWTNVPAVPFGVQLFRFDNPLKNEGRVQVVHRLGNDREEQRAQRILRACDRKFPKLWAWKRDHKARTILVLEENDIQLTNYAIVAETYLPIALSRPDRPDETYLVSTCLEPWEAWPILIDDRTLDDLRVNDYVPRWEINPHNLTAITRR